MRIFILMLIALMSSTAAEAACPDQSASVTIPMVGEAVVKIYDSATCNPLAGPFSINIPGSSLSATSKPSFTVGSDGIHLTANGAPFGTKIAAVVVFPPDTSKTMPLSIIVGGAVAGLVAGTTTP